MPKNPSRFTNEQRGRLRALGLFEEQILELEHSLPVCHAVLRKPATLTEVRDKLVTLIKQMDITLSSIATFLGGQSPGAVEAQCLVSEAERSVGGDGKRLEKALRALTDARDVLGSARAYLKPEQRRFKSASYFPVDRIARALHVGHELHRSLNPQKAIPRYKLRESRTSGTFPEIVTICYEVIGHARTKDGTLIEPARAIRNYQKIKTARKRHLDDLISKLDRKQS
jgi:hypothetical protein